jgi:hypothetical protein
VGPSPLLLIDLLCQPWMTDGDDCETVSGMNKKNLRHFGGGLKIG